jgi:hypothetical protein
MTNFLTHLRDAVIEKKLFPNKSKTGNWLSLLNHQQLEELTSLIESLPNDRDSVEQVSLLVFNLCGLEGIDLHEHYKDDLVQAVKEFSLMVRLERLQRQKYIKVNNGISFRHDPEIEFLKDPNQIAKLLTPH